jgi:hypothetical protein
MLKTEHELKARDAKRNIGAKLLESIQQMKTGKVTPLDKLQASCSAHL